MSLGAVCLICGETRGTCAGGPPLAAVRPIATRQFKAVRGESGPAFAFRSNRRVYELRDGRQVLRYAMNTPIPLLEALRQGQVDLASLSPALTTALKAHGYTQESEDEMAGKKSPKGPKKDKMVKTAPVRKSA